jgi:hypothetical protein
VGGGRLSPANRPADGEKFDPMSKQDKVSRTILPIPDRSHVGLTTYDAEDPDTSFPPIEPLRPPEGASLYLDGEKVGDGRVEVTVPMMFSAAETCDVGKGTGSAVSPDYDARENEFNGEVNWVQIELGQDDHGHMISPEDRFNMAMARQ